MVLRRPLSVAACTMALLASTLVAAAPAQAAPSEANATLASTSHASTAFGAVLPASPRPPPRCLMRTRSRPPRRTPPP